MSAPRVPLASAFSESLGRDGCAGLGAGDELEPLLASVVARAQARWPTVALDPVDFIRFVAERLPEDVPALEALAVAATEDLYLALGCVKHDRAALQAFETAYLREVAAFVSGVDRSPAFADEVRQALRERLFTGDKQASNAPNAPKIAEFTGSGALGGWVRVAALRIALNLKRGDARATAAGRASAPGSMEGAVGAGLSPELHPELRFLQAHYKEPFTEALRESLGVLSDRERTLLRLYHVDGLSLEAMAALYRVHLSTVSRWLGRARMRVAETTTELLRERLGVGASEVDSIAALVLSQVDLSLMRLLGGGG